MIVQSIKPEFPKKRVTRAGDAIRLGDFTADDIVVMENWRASHSKVLRDWQAILRNRCKESDTVFAQRLKRKTTIFDKLARQPKMKFARMHDIAGCRLIFKDMDALNEYRKKLHNSPWIKHKRRRADEKPYPYDYVSKPHDSNSGYRGIHDVYEYVAKEGRSKDWDGLLVEIQYRTRVQHAWATANEIAGSITGHHSKFGRGTEEQHDFFKLASEIIARTEENKKSCYPNLTNKKLYKLFNDVEYKTHLLQKLKSVKIISYLEPNDKGFSILKQNIILVHLESDKATRIFRYKTFPPAQKRYFELEKEYGETADVVLVRAPTEENLKQAYKNYFSDAKDFVQLVESGLEKLKSS